MVMNMKVGGRDFYGGLFRYLPRNIPRYSISGPKFRLRTSRIRGRGANDLTRINIALEENSTEKPYETSRRKK
jgi:hypothetical protein